jgi:aryl sulfotransferase
MMVEKARWIASYPKSGNTWVRCFLEAYITGQLNINHMHVTTADIDMHDYQGVASFDINKLKPLDGIWFRNAVIMNKLMKANDPLIFKTHMANVDIYGIKVIPPQLTMAAIYIVRDPRAVAVSLSRHNNITIDEAIHQMNEARTLLSHGKSIGHFCSTWSDNVETWQKTEFPVLQIKFEDLKEDQEYWFSEIIKTLDIKLEKEKLIKAIELSNLSNLKKQEKEQKFKESLFNTNKFFGSSKDWKEELTEVQVKMIELIHHEYMTKLGYL